MHFCFWRAQKHKEHHIRLLTAYEPFFKHCLYGTFVHGTHSSAQRVHKTTENLSYPAWTPLHSWLNSFFPSSPSLLFFPPSTFPFSSPLHLASPHQSHNAAHLCEQIIASNHVAVCAYIKQTSHVPLVSTDVRRGGEVAGFSPPPRGGWEGGIQKNEPQRSWAIRQRGNVNEKANSPPQWLALGSMLEQSLLHCCSALLYSTLPANKEQLGENNYPD